MAIFNSYVKLPEGNKDGEQPKTNINKQDLKKVVL